MTFNDLYDFMVVTRTDIALHYDRELNAVQATLSKDGISLTYTHELDPYDMPLSAEEFFQHMFDYFPGNLKRVKESGSFKENEK